MTGAEMRALRMRLAVSQSEFARRIFRSRDSVARYESGKQQIPPLVERACRDLEPERR
jgi:DNA-binding transcriptional regulator YiaG